MAGIDQKRGFSMGDACEYIGGISRQQMYRLMGSKILKSYLIGTRRYFLREELDAFLERQIEASGDGYAPSFGSSALEPLSAGEIG